MKKILAIGAFERDNFGDLLFLQILRDYMKNKDVEIVPASIIFSDMRHINGEMIYPYKLMLDLYIWDAVWVVGGEVGGVDITSAVLMNATNEKGKTYLNLNKTERAEYRSILSIPENDSSPAYLPDLKSHKINYHTKMVINSVGLSNAPLNRDTLKSEVKILSNSIVSVRDKRSVEFCKDKNIKHTISPDVVSLISHFHPMKENKNHKDYVVVQINLQLLHDANLNKLIVQLKEISNLLKAPIVLLRAGVTFGHDDESMYVKIVSKYRLLKPQHDIECFNERNPLLIAELIAGSKLCIATSLHCRIVSESYDVPRVSLTNKKVANYVSTWEDEKYPYDVDIEELGDVVKKIKNIIDEPIKSDGELRKKSLLNIEKLYAEIGTEKGVNKQADCIAKGVYAEYAKTQKATLDNLFSRYLEKLETCNRQTQELTNKNQEQGQRVNELEAVIHNTLNSKSYKVGRFTTAPYRLVRQLLKDSRNEK